MHRDRPEAANRQIKHRARIRNLLREVCASGMRPGCRFKRWPELAGIAQDVAYIGGRANLTYRPAPADQQAPRRRPARIRTRIAPGRRRVGLPQAAQGSSRARDVRPQRRSAAPSNHSAIG